MDKKVEHILHQAILAPSGENCQPWKFNVEGQRITLFNNPDADCSVYNWGQRASYVANGAALENIVLAAGTVGYEAEIKLFPDPAMPEQVATIDLRPTQRPISDLANHIAGRCTNRKPYDRSYQLSKAEMREIKQPHNHQARLVVIDDRNKIDDLASTISISERVLFENRSLHDFFFKHINWTKEEDDQKRTGFYIKTLELPPPAKAGFKLFRHWPVLKFFNKLGASAMVARENSKIYSTAAAMLAIVIPNVNSASYVEAGRLLEEVWLRVTKLDLSLQPMTGVLWFHLRLWSGDTGNFSTEHRRQIEEAYETVHGAVDAGDGVVAMLLRIGKSGAPSARSARFSLGKFLA
ncbi:MAG: hypothetical protein AAB468_02060 [Patescibacteria group bacterium]